MNGIKYIADTNILLYIIAGKKEIIKYIDSEFYISEISEIELLGNNKITPLQLESRSLVIENCTIVGFSDHIKWLTIRLKQSYILKIPDAIIAATSIYLNLPLLTADKDSKKIKELELALIEF